MRPSTQWNILQKDLGLCGYNIQLVQELRPVNHCKCCDCDEWVEKKIALYPAFKSKILFSDEAQFWLSDFVI